LIPDEAKESIRSGELKCLTIIPQGNLSFLPFEALIVSESGSSKRYLLDEGPPTLCVPSLTLLKKLRGWTPPNAPLNRLPVLTLGNPMYQKPGEAPTEVRQPVTGSIAAQYLRAGSRPSPLPFTAGESAAVASAFQKHKIGVGQLLEKLATEGSLRVNAPGRRVLHLACHGCSSNLYGNTFGALAIAEGPSAKTNAADDGYLTVGEIYGLDLRHCEIAILSACDTNVGPLQQGEGAWSLSRAFLVAGCQRVVSSLWPVDDEATSILMGRFAESIADGQSTDAVDYAGSLREAKLSLRNAGGKIDNPTYWAPFVLTGPN
jgi:CHAT domain-containing protein